MKKVGLKLLVIVLLLSLQLKAQPTAMAVINEKEVMLEKTNDEKASIYNFKVTDLQGKTFDFASLKGKKIIIVNTASKCGLTPQYKLLESIYQQYKDKNLVIVGFPANNFASQEPGTDSEIESFCRLNYGVSFLMMSKVSVKGADICPLYQFLTQKSKNGIADSDVEWNFQKYLIGTNGQLEKVVSPRTLPTDQEIVGWIEK